MYVALKFAAGLSILDVVIYHVWFFSDIVSDEAYLSFVSFWQSMHKPGIDLFYIFFSLESHPNFWDGLLQHIAYCTFAVLWMFTFSFLIAWIAVLLVRYVRKQFGLKMGI